MTEEIKKNHYHSSKSVEDCVVHCNELLKTNPNTAAQIKIQTTNLAVETTFYAFNMIKFAQ